MNREQFENERLINTMNLLEKAIKWLAPLVFLGSIVNIIRMSQFGGKWASIIQLSIVVFIMILVYLGKNLNPKLKFNFYIISILIFGFVGLIQWGLIGQGLYFILLAIIIASGGSKGFWIRMMMLGIVGVVIISLGFIFKIIQVEVDPITFMQSVSVWITTLLTFSLTSIAVLIWMQVFNQLNEKTQDLYERDQQLQTILNTVPCAFYRCDLDPFWTMHILSKEIENISGYPESDFIDNKKRSYASIIHPDDIQYIKKEIGRNVDSEREFELSYRILHKDGNIRWVFERGLVKSDKNKTVKWIDGFILDETERKRAEILLSESEKKYSTVVNNSNETILIYQDGLIKYINSAILSFTGYTEKDLEGRRLEEFLHPEEKDMILDRITERIKGVEFSDSIEISIRKKDGRFGPVEVNAAKIDYLGEPSIVMFIRDIRKRKLAEEQIKKNLSEKEALLKEIHHRVKNNLQIMNSLIYLQSKQNNDILFKDYAKELSGRIHSMAHIHEQLYKTENMASIHMPAYFESLLDSIKNNFSCDFIEISTFFDDIYLDIDTSVPMGLLFNELFTNVVKHAFPNGQNGKLNISFIEKKEIHVLQFEDDGVGLSKTIDFDNPESMGLKLINVLVQQLSGTVEMLNDSGTTITIKIPFQSK